MRASYYILSVAFCRLRGRCCRHRQPSKGSLKNTHQTHTHTHATRMYSFIVHMAHMLKSKISKKRTRIKKIEVVFVLQPWEPFVDSKKVDRFPATHALAYKEQLAFRGVSLFCLSVFKEFIFIYFFCWSRLQRVTCARSRTRATTTTTKSKRIAWNGWWKKNRVKISVKQWEQEKKQPESQRYERWRKYTYTHMKQREKKHEVNTKV